MSYDTNKINNELISMDIIDKPLIIVLDEDDDDDNEYKKFDITTTTRTTSSDSIIANHTEKQTVVWNRITEQGEQANIGVKNLVETVSIESNRKSKIFRHASKSSDGSDQSIRTIVFDTSFIQKTSQQHRTKPKRKNTSRSNNLSTGSVLSSISFDKVSNILTVSRMGSIYYCVEDLYIKIFSSLCTFNEFLNLLLKPEQIILKQVTLSEKIVLTEKNSRLKKYHPTPYRLISIDSSDYLTKLKQLLLKHKNNQIEKIIDEMRSYKQTSTSILLQNKIPKKHLKNQQTQAGIFMQCTNTVNDNNKLTKLPLRPLHRSKSLIKNHQSIQKHSSRSSSLPSIKLNNIKNSMLKFQTKPYKTIEDNYPMPTIVNVEENVPINNQKSLNLPSRTSTSHPQLCQSLSPYHTPMHTPYTIYYQESHQPIKETYSNYHNVKSKSPTMIPILEKPVYHHTPISKDIMSNERIIYQKHTSSSNSKALSSMNPKQHRLQTNPYPPTKTYFVPLSNCYPCPSKSLTNKTNIHELKSAPVVIQNSSTINNLQLPYFCTRSISLSQAIIEHNRCNLDQVPKLVVRHSKTFSTKTIDTMGQLFPTWFNEPDYRCIHCFNCDQVFTPQLFMTHVDDHLLINEQPLNMTSIQLLTSEKMSEYKVDLWNQFCTNLTIYAREGRIVGFTANHHF